MYLQQSSHTSSIMSDINEIHVIPEMRTMSLPSTSRMKHKKMKDIETVSFSSGDSQPESDTLVEELIAVPEHLIKPRPNLLNKVVNKDYHFKVLVIGDPGVGKTSFVHRYTANAFRSDYRGTVGVDFALKVLELPGNTRVRLQLWDIAGQERFTWMTRVYFKESQGCIIMLDLTSKKSLESVRKWKADLDSKVSLCEGRVYHPYSWH
ncbi:ras-related protein Rab-7L1 isoform X2 [Eurytemora carolleeae]|uniref:ras-related protein Rab-7L1 isoform X2 n=1 Tax=Eurytemora carolleeae TaxID=1294199 RepID=UPI000C791A51|nr:ras-related protein Rab-7L1 isoform X2 [Eurytemora carolleeae]|eukprot:XP_023325917.1 ras-related protein Rab-7L1-like isoform X2 [Eurytemora affinis]